MSNSKVQYIVGAVLFLLSFYQIYAKNGWEFALYASAGAAFITMALIGDNTFPRHKKLLNIISWILILMSAFLLLFLFRTDDPSG